MPVRSAPRLQCTKTGQPELSPSSANTVAICSSVGAFSPRIGHVHVLHAGGFHELLLQLGVLPAFAQIDNYFDPKLGQVLESVLAGLRATIEMFIHGVEVGNAGRFYKRRRPTARWTEPAKLRDATSS